MSSIASSRTFAALLVCRFRRQFRHHPQCQAIRITLRPISRWLRYSAASVSSNTPRPNRCRRIVGSIVLASGGEAHRSARDIRSRRLDAESRNEAAHRLEGNTRTEFSIALDSWPRVESREVFAIFARVTRPELTERRSRWFPSRSWRSRMGITRNNALQGMFGRPEVGPRRIKLEVDAVAACHASGRVMNRADSACNTTLGLITICCSGINFSTKGSPAISSECPGS